MQNIWPSLYTKVIVFKKFEENHEAQLSNNALLKDKKNLILKSNKKIRVNSC
jgi:hypothetical protein